MNRDETQDDSPTKRPEDSSAIDHVKRSDLPSEDELDRQDDQENHNSSKRKKPDKKTFFY